MDCEKFETHLIDELYDELDELTSAAAKRHMAGCARCASLLSGLKATRRVAVLPMLDVPAGLEDRILAAAREAQKVVPLRRRVAHAISSAGSWSMRPQAAMAASFLLMVGVSLLLVKGKAMHAPPSANVTVSAQGAPAPSAMTGTIARPSEMDESADNAHGAGLAAPKVAAAPIGEGYGGPAASASPFLSGPAAMPVAPAATGNAINGFIANNAPAPASPPSDSFANADTAIGGTSDGTAKQLAPGNAGASAGAGYAQKPRAHASIAKDQPRGLDDEQGYGSAYGSSAGGGVAQAPAAAAPASPSAPKPQESKKAGAPSDFDNAMAEYKAGNYSEAVRLFDLAAASGDRIAALRAAQTVEAQGSCSAAIGRYDQLATNAFGTTAGYDATLSAGRCFRILGDYVRARQRLNKLLTVTTHARLAQNEIDLLSSTKGAARAATKASPPPAQTAPQAAPPPAKTDVAY